jgi:lipoic acid synthetase
LAFIPVKIMANGKATTLKKPIWLKIKIPSNSAKVTEIKQVMRKHNLNSVCEEVSCPNLHECFNHGTATFMILSTICTRRCPFCNVAHGRPLPVSAEEPEKLAATIRDMKLKYVLITSVDRNDLRDGGAQYFVGCTKAIRKEVPHIKIEILVPDFRGRVERALDILSKALPDVFNYHLKTAPHMYREKRYRVNHE